VIGRNSGASPNWHVQGNPTPSEGFTSNPVADSKSNTVLFRFYGNLSPQLITPFMQTVCPPLCRAHYFLATRARSCTLTNYAVCCRFFSHSLTPADPPIAHYSAKSDSPIRIRRGPLFGGPAGAPKPPPLQLGTIENAEQDKTETLVWPVILCPAAWGLWLCILSTTTTPLKKVMTWSLPCTVVGL
jgi:hypothetical protein